MQLLLDLPTLGLNQHLSHHTSNSMEVITRITRMRWASSAHMKISMGQAQVLVLSWEVKALLSIMLQQWRLLR